MGLTFNAFPVINITFEFIFFFIYDSLFWSYVPTIKFHEKTYKMIKILQLQKKKKKQLISKVKHWS
jgi:hypothetical protein